MDHKLLYNILSLKASVSLHSKYTDKFDLYNSLNFLLFCSKKKSNEILKGHKDE